MSMEEQRASLLGANASGDEAAGLSNQAAALAKQYGTALQQELAGSTQPEAQEALALAVRAEEALITGAFYLVEASSRVAAMAAKL